MDLNNNAEKYRIADYFGEAVQMQQLVEEMSELTKAICKYARVNGIGQPVADSVTKETVEANLVEELADVALVLEQVIYLHGCKDKIENIMAEKIVKINERISKSKSGNKKSSMMNMMEQMQDMLDLMKRQQGILEQQQKADISNGKSRADRDLVLPESEQPVTLTEEARKNIDHDYKMSKELMELVAEAVDLDDKHMADVEAGLVPPDEDYEMLKKIYNE